MANLTQTATTFFTIKKQLKEFGSKSGTLDGADEYRNLTLAAEEFAKMMIEREYPKLSTHVKVIGYLNISKKMIEDHK